MDDLDAYEWDYPVYTLIDVRFYKNGNASNAVRLYAAHGTREFGLSVFTDTHLATRFIAEGVLIETAVVPLPDPQTLLACAERAAERGAIHAVFDTIVHDPTSRERTRYFAIERLIDDLRSTDDPTAEDGEP